MADIFVPGSYVRVKETHGTPEFRNLTGWVEKIIPIGKAYLNTTNGRRILVDHKDLELLPAHPVFSSPMNLKTYVYASSLQSQVLRVAHEVPETRKHLLPILRKYAYGEMKTLVSGPHVRIQWKDHPENSLSIQELPTKPLKSRLRKAEFGMMFLFNAQSHNRSLFLMSNLLMDAKLHAGMTYEASLTAMRGAIAMAVSETDKGTDPMDKWERDLILRQPQESLVFWQEVEPADYKPMTVSGKDFTIQSEWNKFKAYSPGSDLQLSDPYYHYFSEKSPGAARKLFKILKADPTILKNVSHSVLSDWLTKVGVGFDSHHSVWS